MSKHNTFLFRASQIPDLLPALWALKCVNFFFTLAVQTLPFSLNLCLILYFVYVVMRTLMYLEVSLIL